LRLALNALVTGLLIMSGDIARVWKSLAKMPDTRQRNDGSNVPSGARSRQFQVRTLRERLFGGHMSRLRTMLPVVAIVSSLTHVSTARADNITPYYLFDGDSNVGYRITNGKATAFDTFFLGYPAAIRSSIWLGERDDSFAREYSLDGSPTGATSSGGRHFSQLLDGTAGRAHNFGVECCTSQNSVTIANSDWTSQRVLFDIPFDGSGIAYDGRTDTLYVSDELSRAVHHYSLNGRLLDSFELNQVLIGLAYEEVTDRFWGFNRTTHHLVAFNRAGTVLEDIDIPGFAPSNPWGGEMPVGAAVTPEPGSLLLLGTGALFVRLARTKARGRRFGRKPPVATWATRLSSIVCSPSTCAGT
jgi:hypothetical protein